MIEPGIVEKARPRATWLVRLARYAGYLVLLILALAALGTLLPSIPIFASIGPLLISAFGSWIVLISTIAALLAVRRWRQVRTPVALGMVCLAIATALCAAISEARQIAVARANGIPVSLARTFWLGTDAHTGAAPVLAQYGSFDRHPLQAAIYRPAIGRKIAPILVYVHGGGWGGGTVLDREADMRWFADRGYLVISIDYTLSTKKLHLWNIAEGQVGCALAWIGMNASRLGGDPTRLALFGESAGGNLVINVSYKAAADKLHPACSGTVPRIAATIAPYPVLDAVRMYYNDDLIAGLFAPTMTTQYTGGTPNEYPDRYFAVSSSNHITRSAPPTLLFPGLADHLLPPEVAFAFAARARAAGVDIHVVAVPHAEHSFDQRSGSIGSQIVRNATLQFLARKGLAP